MFVSCEIFFITYKKSVFCNERALWLFVTYQCYRARIFKNRNNYLKNNNTDGTHLRNLRTESLANIIGLTSLWMAANTLCQLLAKYSKQMLDNFRRTVNDVKQKMCFETNSSLQWESIQARLWLKKTSPCTASKNSFCYNKRKEVSPETAQLVN